MLIWPLKIRCHLTDEIMQ